jgi:hypothetical protein
MDVDQLRQDLQHGSTPHLRQRRIILALSLIGIASMAPTTLLQIGVLKHLPDPPLKSFNSDKVNSSYDAYRFGVPDGTLGFFHPDNFTFGQPLYLSQLYRAIEAVDGVDSAQITKFHRFDQETNEDLERGYVPMGRLEVVRLENDPSLPENGVIQFNLWGGK